MPVEDQVRDAAGDPEKSFAAFQKIQQCLTLESDKEIVDHEEVKVARAADGMQIQLVQHKADEQGLQLLRNSCQQKSDADAQANRIFLAWKQRQHH